MTCVPFHNFDFEMCGFLSCFTMWAYCVIADVEMSNEYGIGWKIGTFRFTGRRTSLCLHACLVPPCGFEGHLSVAWKHFDCIR